MVDGQPAHHGESPIPPPDLADSLVRLNFVTKYSCLLNFSANSSNSFNCSFLYRITVKFSLLELIWLSGFCAKDHSCSSPIGSYSMLVLKFLIRLISVGTAPIVPTVWNILLMAVFFYKVIGFHCYVDPMTFLSALAVVLISSDISSTISFKLIQSCGTVYF